MVLNHTIILAAAGVFLGIQLLSIQVEVKFPTISYGETAAVAYAESRIFTRQNTPAVFTDFPQEHDSLVFLGDVMLGRNVEYLMDRYGTEYPFSGFDVESLSTNPYVIANFEAAVPAVHQPTPPMMLNFSVDRLQLPALREAGIDLVSLANNHSNDFGEAGYQSTLDAFIELGVNAVGHAYRVDTSSFEVVQIADTAVAVIALHTLEVLPAEAELAALFAEAARVSEVQIVYIHWGEEYSRMSSSRQRTIAETLVAAGADLIIGHHPHVVQEISVVDGVLVLYSLGNYVFDQYFSSAVQEGLIVQLEFDHDAVLHLLPVTSERSLSRPEPMQMRAHAAFLQDLAARSDESLREDIKAGIIPLELLVAPEPKIAMISK